MTAERFRIRPDALAKSLRPGDLVICDSPAEQKVSRIREVPQAKSKDIRFPPSYGPDRNPIEKAILQLKSRLGKV